MDIGSILVGAGSLFAVLVTLYTAATAARKSGFLELREVVNALQVEMVTLRAENKALRENIRQLEKENMSLAKSQACLRAENAALRAENAELKATIQSNALELAELRSHIQRIEAQRGGT